MLQEIQTREEVPEILEEEKVEDTKSEEQPETH